MILYQQDTKPLEITTTVTDTFVTAKLERLDTDETIGNLKAYAYKNKADFFLKSSLSVLQIQEVEPLLEGNFWYIYATPIRLTVEGIEHLYDVRCGLPSTNKLTNKPVRTSLDFPFQQVHFIENRVSNDKLFARVNSDEPIQVDTLKIVGDAAFMVINYHHYYSQLNLFDGDVVEFFWEKLTITQKITFNAQYFEEKFTLVMRNRWGFFDVFQLTGTQEYRYPVVTNSFETMNTTKVISTDSYESVTVHSGLLEQGEKRAIAEDCLFGEFWHYDNKVLRKMVLESKELPKSSTKDPQESIKLEFRYTENLHVTL